MQALAALSTPPLRGRKNPAWKGPTKYCVNQAAERLCPTHSVRSLAQRCESQSPTGTQDSAPFWGWTNDT